METAGSYEAAEYIGGRLYGPDARLCRTWRCDSRDVAPGDAFVALKGEKTDGHLYVHQAIERGARLLLVEQSEIENLSVERPEYAGITFIAASDTTRALEKIAGMYLADVAPKVIGITGSVGKTTTRELIVSVLKQKYRLHSAIRSFNTNIGCSLTVLSMPSDTQILVLELGTNHFGEIREMVSLFPVDFAVITEVVSAHLEGFGSVDGVLRAKMEICASQKLKTVVYNADNTLLGAALPSGADGVRLVGVGRDAGADYRIIGAEMSLAGDGAAITCEYAHDGKVFAAAAPLFGMQHVYNIGFAYAAGDYFNVPADDIKSALAALEPIGGRGVCRRLKNNAWIIDESYNANPGSMSAAIKNVASVGKSQRLKTYGILGGMRELGASSAEWHRKTLAMTGGFEKVTLLGGEWISTGVELPENAVYYETFEELAAGIDTEPEPDSVTLVKGSNSYGLKKIVTLLTEGSNAY